MTTAKTPIDPADPHRQSPATVEQWSGEFGDSLKGKEEAALAQAFGGNLDALAARGVIDTVRALVFCHRMREGDDAKAAKAFALDLTRRQAADYFLGLGMPPVEGAEAEGKD